MNSLIQVSIQTRAVTASRITVHKSLTIQSTFIPKNQEYEDLLAKTSSAFQELFQTLRMKLSSSKGNMEISENPLQLILTFRLSPETDLKEVEKLAQSILNKHFQVTPQHRPPISPLRLQPLQNGLPENNAS